MRIDDPSELLNVLPDGVLWCFGIALVVTILVVYFVWKDKAVKQ